MLSQLIPTWRKPSLTIVSVEGFPIEHAKRGCWNVSLSTVKDIFSHYSHIKQFIIFSKFYPTTRWAELETFMPHLEWLELTLSNHSNPALDERVSVIRKCSD